MQPGNTEKTVPHPKWAGWLLRPGAWFWCALALGAAIRLYFVFFTQGTTDVILWQQHAAGVHDLGLIGYYHANALMNHPPFIGVAESLLLRASVSTGVPFRILLRAPFALIDAGTTLLLLGLLLRSPWRFFAAACYWLNPLTMILSAYHGNTDSSVAFFVLLSVWLLSRGNNLVAGVALGIGFWIKLPVVLAVPALVLFIQNGRKQLFFLFAVGVTAISMYLPALFLDAGIVHANVFGYHGEVLQTTSGAPVWGPRVMMSIFLPKSETWPAGCVKLADFYVDNSWWISLVLLLVLAWLRRRCRSTMELCATLGMGYVFFYGFTDNWAFQYFAWSVPFWFFLRPWFCLAATTFAGGYIYSLYWFLCGNPWLSGKWDFEGHPGWPAIVVAFRNLAVLFFFFSAWFFLISAIKEQIIAWFRPPDAGSPASPEPADAGD
jgi:hypothetical protein